MPNVGKYVLANADKERRARVYAGKDATDEAVVAQYDRLGGAIYGSDGVKIASGTFWNFAEKKPQEAKKEVRITKKASAPAKKTVKKNKKVQ